MLGNMAGNCISFATRALNAAGHEDPSQSAIRGIAIAVATFSCFIHAFSRRGGIILSDIFAIIKLGILFLIIATTVAHAAGAFPSKNHISENTKPANAFGSGSSEAGGYAQAFLSISRYLPRQDAPRQLLKTNILQFLLMLATNSQIMYAQDAFINRCHAKYDNLGSRRDQQTTTQVSDRHVYSRDISLHPLYGS